MSTKTENYVCTTCGFDVPKERRHNVISLELWSGGANGENARHVWLQGCDAARKRVLNVEEPDLIY